MEKGEMIKMLTSKMEEIVMNTIKTKSTENPMLNTPLESIHTLEVFNGGCEHFKGFLNKMQDTLSLTDDDIEIILKEGSNRIYNKVFDNEIPSGKKNNTFNKDKFIISSIFYKFCFSSEVTSLFLQKSEKSKAVAKMMSNTQYEHESITLSMFRAFLTKNEIDFDYEKNGEFVYNSFKFRMNMERTVFGNDSTYLEILKNSINNVQNEEGLDMAFATHFIVFVQNNYPNSIFIVIYDPFIEQYAIRKVYEDGVSSKIAFINNNELDTFTDEIIKHIEKR